MTERTGHNPNPADPEELRQIVSQQGNFLELLYSTISRITTVQEDLLTRVKSNTQSFTKLTELYANPAPGLTSSGNTAASATCPCAAPENIRLQPEPFFGDVEACGGFLLQCLLICQQAPRFYQTDHSKITLIINSLRSKALQWAQAFLSANPLSHLSYERFLGEFRLVFDQPHKQDEATRRLLALKQRNRPVSDHVIDFRILAVEAGWPDLALKGVFYQSLNEQIKDHLCSQPEARSFEELVSAALRSDIRIRERQKERSPYAKFPVPSKTMDEPMQIGHSKLSEEERRKRREAGACFYCGAKSHLVSGCPVRLNAQVPSLDDRPRGELSTTDSGKEFMYLPVKLCLDRQVHDLRALVDSGAEQSLIDFRVVNHLSIPTEPLETPIEASGLGGQHLSRITHRTKPILLVTSGNHRESVQFYITQSAHTPIVLGFTWLRLHNPQFNWTQGSVTQWSPYCLANCLLSAVPRVSPIDTESPVSVDLASIPSCYHDLKAVFSKSNASALPPHRPYDCAITLLPGAPLPKGRLFNLSGPERSAMEQYIQEALSLGHIRPSSSPVGAGFFFVAKKDKTLRPCIDYRKLNQITVKDKYSLPLISSVFDSVQQARIFTKLDLRNAYHLVRIKEGDEWKTAFKTPLGYCWSCYVKSMTKSVSLYSPSGIQYHEWSLESVPSRTPHLSSPAVPPRASACSSISSVACICLRRNPPVTPPTSVSCQEPPSVLLTLCFLIFILNLLPATLAPPCFFWVPASGFEKCSVAMTIELLPLP
uniref:ribonuclease H n=1 Tax=Oryzias latipes TaxID=8090 RepID=A0A3P9I9W9_ORYLA